jgi:hypothetical protein
VNVVSFIEPFDRLDDASGGGRYRQQYVDVNDAASAHRLRDRVAIGGRRWCAPSEHGGQRRSVAGLRNKRLGRGFDF